jgi:hypothetical protein
MSSNKYWEMWMDRKKNLTNSAKEKSYEKSPINNDQNKTFNSFLSERQT